MKLLSINLARALWFCPIFELNPKGKSLSPVLPLLVDTYKFKKMPPPQEMLDVSKGIKFEGGEFRNSKGNEVALNFTVYNEGFAVDTRSSTKDSDAFLEELLTRISKDFDLPHYEQVIRKKNYLSQVYIYLEKSLELFSPKFREISKYLTDSSSLHFEIGSIIFSPDPATIAQATIPSQAPFTIERVIGVPFAENKYYSSSGLETDQHLELLSRLEVILSDI